MCWWRVRVTPLKSRFPRAHIDLARRGAWSAAIRHAPRVLGGAVGTKGRAQLIKETFCMVVILTSAKTKKTPNFFFRLPGCLLGAI